MSKMIERKFAAIENIKLESRKGESNSDLPEIVGYSALFDSETIINSYWGDGWREVIKKGFFKPAIENKHDVRALFNHNADYVLGRSTSPKKTLILKEDKEGLFVRITPPNNSIGRDVVESIERGDITGQSFAFTIAEEKWTKGDRKKGELDTRELLVIDTLYDVGPVTYPAFQETDISVDRTANTVSQIASRARALESFGESIPNYVAREVFKRTQIQVPTGLDFSGMDINEFRQIVREEVSSALNKEKEENLTNPDNKAQETEDSKEPEAEVIAEETPSEEQVKLEVEEVPSEDSQRSAKIKRELEKIRLLENEF